MFDFRYHALSLVAVFLALTVGILLGIVIGDAGLVSNAERDLRTSLRGDVEAAREEAKQQRSVANSQKRFVEDLYPAVVDGRLEGLRLGIVGVGGVQDSVVRNVRESLEYTGAKLQSVVVIDPRIDLKELGERAGKGRYSQLAKRQELVEPFGNRVGRQYLAGGALIQRVDKELFSSTSGESGQLDAVVLVRKKLPEDLTAEQDKTLELFQQGLLKGFNSERATVVGVELSDQEDSQIESYRESSISSVDNIDQLSGHVSLVFVLAGAKGTYGVREQADSLIPKGLATEQRE